MLAAYYSKGADSRELFAPYKIAESPSFEQYLNKFNVVKIDLNAMYGTWTGLKQEEKKGDNFISFVSEQVCNEFKATFKDVDFGDKTALSTYIQQVYTQKEETFIIIIDEYDVLVREEVSKEEADSWITSALLLTR